MNDEIERHIEAMKAILAGEGQQEIMQAVGNAIGAAVIDDMPEYPDPSRKPLPKIYPRGGGRMSKFPSEKARKMFFDGIKDGTIRIPYVRTGTLGKSITYDVQVQGTKGQVTVGTRIAYAPDVIGNRNQQIPYHRDHWWSLETVVEGMADKVAKITASAFILEVRKRIK